MRRLLVVLAAGATVVLSACATPAVVDEAPAEPVISGPQALYEVVQPALYQLPVKTTERIGDGAIVVENRGAQAIRIVDFQPVFDTLSSKEVEILGTTVLGLDPANAADTGVGITRAYPPELPPTNTRHDSAGMALLPQGRYVLMVGLRVRGGTALVKALRVTFEVDGARHVKEFMHMMALCTGRPAGAMDCGVKTR